MQLVFGTFFHKSLAGQWFRHQRRRFLHYGLLFFDFHQGLEFNLAVPVKAGARWNNVTHNHVFLEPAQVINTRHGSRFGQNARRVLEGGRAQEAFSFQRGLGDAEQNRLGFGWFAAHLVHALVLFVEFDLVDLLAPEERSVSRLGDAHFTQHLSNDDFNVLVVDRHTLEAIDLLHFVDQVLLQLLRSANIEDFMRIDRAFGQLLSFSDVVAFEDDDVLADRDEMFLLSSRGLVLDDHAALAPDTRTKIDNAIDLGNLGRVLGPTSFEQFSNARQTTGDILRLGGLARRFRHEGPGDDLVAFIHDNVRARRNP